MFRTHEKPATQTQKLTPKVTEILNLPDPGDATAPSAHVGLFSIPPLARGTQTALRPGSLDGAASSAAGSPTRGTEPWEIVREASKDFPQDVGCPHMKLQHFMSRVWALVLRTFSV